MDAFDEVLRGVSVKWGRLIVKEEPCQWKIPLDLECLSKQSRPSSDSFLRCPPCDAAPNSILALAALNFQHWLVERK